MLLQKKIIYQYFLLKKYWLKLKTKTILLQLIDIKFFIKLKYLKT